MSQKRKKNYIESTFGTGSWNTYLLVDYVGPSHVTASTITRGLQVFQEQYMVGLDVHTGEDLLFWELTLEEREVRQTRATQQSKKNIYNYKFAIQGDDGLLFCNKHLSVKIKKLLEKAFNCSELQLLNLTDADPVNLLMLFKQSSREAPGHLKLVQEEKKADLLDKRQHCALLPSHDQGKAEAEAAAVSKVQQALGSRSEHIPCIRKVTVSISNVPSNTKSLKDFRWSHVEAEICAPSVFHLYKEIGEMNLLTKVPPWLERMRTTGKTTCQAKYT